MPDATRVVGWDSSDQRAHPEARHAATLLQVGQLSVELDLHLHGAQRLDAMRLIRQHEAGMAGVKDDLGGRVEHPIAQAAAEDADDAPHAGFGAMFPAQPGR